MSVLELRGQKFAQLETSLRSLKLTVEKTTPQKRAIARCPKEIRSILADYEDKHFTALYRLRDQPEQSKVLKDADNELRD